MNSITYRGYDATIEYDNEDEIFVGHLAGIRDDDNFTEDWLKIKAFLKDNITTQNNL